MNTTAAATVPGRFGAYGGCYAPETLMTPLAELDAAFAAAREDDAFAHEFVGLLRDFVGRPTPLTFAARMTAELGARNNARVYLKREDLAHTGAHKINNSLGQCLLAKRMGKTRVIAETGAGQHGVATATACAALGLACVVYMGEVDMARQAPNVYRMRLLGAEVRGVASGSKTLKDAINEAMRDWVANVRDTFYVLGSALGPHPYPTIVREFQRVIGREAREQILAAEGKLPDLLIACVGGGSNAIGLFADFIGDAAVQMVGVEAGGDGVTTPRHAARFAPGTDGGSPGVLHGTRTYLLQDAHGQIRETHSVSAGLDYPAVGPEHAAMFESGRASYTSVTDAEALDAFAWLSRTEGIIPALESAHAIAHARKVVPALPADSVVIVNCSGRGDKDMDSVRRITESAE